MGVPRRLHRYTFRDYLAVEEAGTIKHEFLDGEIYAMAGGSPLHAALAAAVIAALGGRVPAGCRVYSSDLRVRVVRTGLACYPDVTVICGAVQPDPESPDTATNPRVVVEVLSASTQEFDLGEKLEHYQQIPSLEAVVYVWQDRRLVEVRERAVAGSGAWTTAASTVDAVTVRALGSALDVAAIYAAAGWAAA